jgi:hypothetical protein
VFAESVLLSPFFYRLEPGFLYWPEPDDTDNKGHDAQSHELLYVLSDGPKSRRVSDGSAFMGKL